MKSKCILIIASLMLLLSAFFSGETAAANSELLVTYSGISLVIDGSLRAEALKRPTLRLCKGF